MYKQIFEKIENSLLLNYGLSKSEFDNEFFSFKSLNYSIKSDAYYFDILKFIPFYAGFKTETVLKKVDVINKYFPDYKIVSNYSSEEVDKMMNDPEMIKNLNKINSIIKNAKAFVNLINEYGSIHNYIESFKPNNAIDNLFLLKHSLQNTFSYLGEITVFHFMTEIGLNVLKPDRVIQRIFERLGLIVDRGQILESISIGQQMAFETGYPIRYVDVILVIFGQIAKNGICFEEKPKCNLCQLSSNCNYNSKK